MNKRIKGLFVILFASIIMLPISALGAPNLNGGSSLLGSSNTAHLFSLKAYKCDSLNSSNKCLDANGNIDKNPPELNPGDNMPVGKIIKIDTYYEVGPTPDVGMQWAFSYDPTYVEPVKKANGTLYTYMDKTTTENGGIWPPEDDGDPDSATTWIIKANDDATNKKLRFIAKDSNVAKPLENDGVLTTVFVKVLDTTPNNTPLEFNFDAKYTKVSNKETTSTTSLSLTAVAELDNDTTLKNITVSKDSTNYTLNPEFNKDTKKYTVYVPNETSEVNVDAETTKETSSVTGTGNKSLEVSTNNTASLLVTAQSGDTDTYDVDIYRLNNDATLSSLGLTDVDFGAFDKDTTSYTATVPYTTESTTVSATPTDANATVSGTGNKSLSVGENTVSVEVTPENCKSEYESVPGNTCTKKTYTVTVTREAASVDASLDDLKVDGTTVSGFNKDTLSYTLDDVANDKTSISIEATTSEEHATITGTGNKELQVGDNSFDVVVTAQDGTTTKTYTINVRRKSNDNTLKSLSVTSDPEGTLSPAFNKDTKEYTYTTDPDETEVVINAEATEEHATVEGTGTYDPSTTNKVEIKVTSENGTVNTYTVNLERAKSKNADLKSLGVTDETISPAFDKDTLSYTVTVPSDKDKATITAEVADDRASLTGTGEKNLDYGENTFDVVVTGEDGTTKKTYTVKITREKKTDATLSDLKVDDVTVSGFDKDTLSYTLPAVKNDKTSITIAATPTDSDATVTGTGSQNLVEGDNSFDVVVTAQDGTTTKTYTINIRRQSNDASLKSLEVTSDPEGTLSPAFNSDTKEYTFSAPADVTEVEIAAEANSENALVTGTGKYNPRETSSVDVTVTGEDGTINTYSITFEVAKSTNANLKSLGVTGQTITPTFDKDTTSYSVTVPSDTENATITAEVEDDRATLTGTGNVELGYGDNMLDVVVTAEDGTTKKTYTVNIIREKKTNADLDDLQADDVTVPGFDKDTLVYDLGNVNSEKTTIKLSATTSDNDATIDGAGTKDLVVGDNSFDIVVTAQDGTTKKTYTVKVKRLNSAKNLESLTITSDPEGTLSPAFDPETTEYTYEADPDESEVTISATVPEGSNATVTGTGTYNPRETDKVEVTVKAEDGTEKTYTVNLTLAKSRNADLKSLGVTDETISPAFDKDTLSYTVTVPSDKDKATITAEVADDRASLTGTGEKDLIYGNNSFDVVVTAEDGTTTKTYTVNIEREKKTDATLKDLKVGGETVTGFDPETKTYTVDNVSNDTTTISIEATTNDIDATLTGIGTKTLQEGDNSFDIVVTAQDGVTTETYTVNVRRMLDDATLKSLTVTSDPAGSMDKTFSPEEVEYTYTTAPGEDEVEINAETNDTNATVSGTGKYNPQETDKVELLVTSENGTTKVYTVNLVIAKSDNANLDTLEVEGQEITPVFDKDTLSYTLDVDSDTDKVVIKATAEDEHATLTGTGEKTLTYGSNVFNVVVTAEDGETTKTYTVTVTREMSNEVTLSDLTVDEVTVDGFDPATTSYDIGTVENDVTSMTIGATAEDENATVSGTGKVDLEVGENTFEVVVTAQDGVTKGTYTIKVTREADTNNNLKSLEIEGQEITPAFDKDTTSYTLTVPSDVDKIKVNAESESDAATVDGTGEHELQPGENTVEVKVTAEDGTEKTYTIVVTKEEDEDEKITSIEYGHEMDDTYIYTGNLNAKAINLKDELDNDNEKLVVTLPSTEDEDGNIVDGEEISDSDYIGSGYVVKLMINGVEKDRKTIIVKGDVDSNTQITLLDGVTVCYHYLGANNPSSGKPTLEGYQLITSDVSGDGEVTLADAVAIVYHYVEKSPLSYKTVYTRE